MAKWQAANGEIDILVHALAFAPREDLDGAFADTSRDGFAARHGRLGVLASSRSCREANAAGLLHPGSSVLTLSYYGAEKVVANYNVMGVAKAALEASVRYLAADLGPSGVRVNAISAGPVRTLSAAGIARLQEAVRDRSPSVAPLRSNITIEDVGKTALWLASDLSSAVTGEVVYVDGGFNVMGVPARWRASSRGSVRSGGDDLVAAARPWPSRGRRRRARGARSPRPPTARGSSSRRRPWSSSCVAGAGVDGQLREGLADLLGDRRWRPRGSRSRG